MKADLLGKRIDLISTTDLYTKLKWGDRGTIDFIDDTGAIFVNWENGEGLGLVHGEDRYRILEETWAIKKSTVGYARVSTKGQEENTSLDTQREAIGRYAEDHGFDLI